jgi:hypothetical protein
MLRWSHGNTKLAKTGALLGFQVWSFNLPAFESSMGFRVCPGAASCAAICYAQQGWFHRSVVAGLREDNLAELRRCGNRVPAIAKLLRELVAGLPDVVGGVRLHDSGDFYSRHYLEAWMRTIAADPGRVYYAYTKSVPLFRGLDLPANFRLVYSEGGRWDDQIPDGAPRARIFATHEERIAAGYVDGNGDEGDLPAIRGDARVGLVYHGAHNEGRVDSELRQGLLFSGAA